MRNFIPIPDRPRNLCISFKESDRVFLLERKEVLKRLGKTELTDPACIAIVNELKALRGTTIAKYGIMEKPSIVDGETGILASHLILPPSAKNFEFICEEIRLPSFQVLKVPLVILFDKD